MDGFRVVLEVGLAKAHSCMDDYKVLSPEDFPEWAQLDCLCYFNFSTTVSHFDTDTSFLEIGIKVAVAMPESSLGRTHIY